MKWIFNAEEYLNVNKVSGTNCKTTKYMYGILECL